jgi:hypothetical protein
MPALEAISASEFFDIEMTLTRSNAMREIIPTQLRDLK